MNTVLWSMEPWDQETRPYPIADGDYGPSPRQGWLGWCQVPSLRHLSAVANAYWAFEDAELEA